ncbi:sigma factor-like helix-turn-helix DNA-binding protein [Sphingomonas glacialis]|nr:sigma factor-like helix-turn-helix DNA-binding protein [Sphingomonas glacialis]
MLGKLIPHRRDAVLLAGKGVLIEDAACQLVIPEGTFKSRVARGRAHLRI